MCWWTEIPLHHPQYYMIFPNSSRSSWGFRQGHLHEFGFNPANDMRIRMNGPFLLFRSNHQSVSILLRQVEVNLLLPLFSRENPDVLLINTFFPEDITCFYSLRAFGSSAVRYR
jgi:hypothetical protein